MKIKRKMSEHVFDVFNVLFLSFIVIISLYPIWHAAMASFSSNAEVMRHQGAILYPLGKMNVGAYKVVFENPAVLRGYFNTMFILVVGCTLNIVMTSLAAYILSRKDFMFAKPMMIIIVITMYFSGGLIPFYFTVKDMGMDGTLWALIIPGAINTFYLVILKTAFAGIPDSLEEAAKVDGARHLSILFKVVLPLSMPTIAVLILYYGVGHWNSWFNAMIFLRSEREKYPLQLVLREILLQNTMADSTRISSDNAPDIGETVKYALIIVSTVPILLVYPFLQKYFVKGVLVGAVKG